MNNADNIVLAALLTLVLAAVVALWWPRSKRASSQSDIRPFPFTVPSRKALDLTAPTPSTQVPYLTAKILSMLTQAGQTAKSVYNALRADGYTEPLRVRNVQSILEAQARRQRPPVGSPRERRNGTIFFPA